MLRVGAAVVTSLGRVPSRIWIDTLGGCTSKEDDACASLGVADAAAIHQVDGPCAALMYSDQDGPVTEGGTRKLRRFVCMADVLAVLNVDDKGSAWCSASGGPAERLEPCQCSIEDVDKGGCAEGCGNAVS